MTRSAVRLCVNQGNINGGTLNFLSTSILLIPNLPNELAECCLARVPWICLMRFKTVSKTWASRIGSHKFSALRSQLGFLGRVLIVVSIPQWIGQPKVSVFDPEGLAKSRRHKPLAVFNFPREVNYCWRNFRCAVIGPDLFIIGGQHIVDSLSLTDWSQRFDHCYGFFCPKDNSFVTCKTVWRFNFVSKKWTLVAPMQFARQDFACAVIDGKIYVAGGKLENTPNYLRLEVDSAEMYDYEHDRWQLLPPFTIRSFPRSFSDVSLVYEQCMGVALEDRFYVKTLNSGSAKVFDTSKQEWKTVQNMWPGNKGRPRALTCFDHSLYAIESKTISLQGYNENLNHWNDIMSTPSTMKRIARKRKGFLEGVSCLSMDQLINVPSLGLFWMGSGGRLYRAQGRWVSCGNVEIAHDDEVRLFLSTELLRNEAIQPWIQEILMKEDLWIHILSKVAIVGSSIVCI